MRFGEMRYAFVKYATVKWGGFHMVNSAATEAPQRNKQMHSTGQRFHEIKIISGSGLFKALGT